jgi:glycosyltransferase involved in cell wall biosynthesis
LRITHVISSPAAGGAEIYVKDLCLSMPAAGHQVFVLFLESASETGRSPAFERDFLRELADAGIGSAFLGRRCRRNPILGLARLKAHARAWRPQVVHAHLYWGVLFCMAAGVPVVYTHHNIRLKAPAALYRWVLDRYVDAYVAICGACEQQLSRVSRGCIVRIDNGVDAARIHVRDAGIADGDALDLIAVGRLVPQKHYGLMLAAAAMLGDLAFRLRIVGEGPESGALREQAQALGVADKVQFLGNSREVPQLLAASDLFVMSSAWEGLPISLIEATLTGLPVLVTGVGGCAEVVGEVGNGVVVDSQAPAAFAAALRGMIQDRPALRQYARNALANSGRFRLDHAVAKHLSLYERLACASATAGGGAR